MDQSNVERPISILESEQRFRAVFDHHFQFTGILEPSGHVIMANQTALDFIGAQASDVIGKSFEQTPWFNFDQNVQKKVADALKVAAGGQFVRYETIHRDVTGEFRHIDFSIKPVLDEQGKVIYLVPEGRDITDIRQAQKQALEAISFSSLMLIKYNLKTENYDYISPAVFEISGFSEDEFRDMSREQFLKRAHPDDIEAFEAQTRRLLDPSLGDKRRQDTIQIRFKHRDGHYVWLHLDRTVLVDPDGIPEAVVGVYRDISKEKKAEAQLQQYEHLVAASHDLMFLVDHQHAVQAVSDAFAECFGKQRMHVVGLPLKEVVGDDFYRDVIEPRLKRCVPEGGIHEQMWANFPDGERRYIDMIMVPNLQKSTDGEAVGGYVTSARDMTEKRRLEDQLRQAYKMEAIGTLAGGIAHDFNNILSAVMGYSELVLSSIEQRDALRPHIEKIHQAGQRATELVRQILAFSRQTEQEVKPLQLKLVVKEALKLLRASIPTTIQIESRIQSNASVMADPTQMHQIIMNLCANAAYAMKAAGGILTVRLQDFDQVPNLECSPHEIKADRYIKLSVMDTGIGMTPQVIERIFDPYFTTKPKNEGTGMGLSLIHGIVKSCNGFIEVCSQPGMGSQFYVYLPAIERSTLRKRTDEQPPIPRGSERILYIDDEEAIVEIAELMLKTLGYQVTCMLSSVDALKRFKENPSAFDAVITDLTMPSMTGDKLAVEMLRVRPDIPIIIATGFSEKLTGTDIAALGIRKLIMKPILIRDIAEALRMALDSA